MNLTATLHETVYHEVMKRFDHLVTSAIEINKLNRQLYASEKWSLHPVQYAQEFCTVHINCGRRIGKTEYIKNNLAVGDVVIVPNRGMQYDTIHRVNWYHIFVPEDCRNGLPVHFLQDYKPRTIWFDECGFCNDRDIDLVYNTFIGPEGYEQTWVRLGK